MAGHRDVYKRQGYALTQKKDLSQPGQFACEERVDVVGPKKTLTGVSILGPVRSATQIELSLTDARSIGVSAPIRESGDVAGSAPCKLVGPKGEVTLSEGVIAAKRHIHMTTADAAAMGLRDKDEMCIRDRLESAAFSLAVGCPPPPILTEVVGASRARPRNDPQLSRAGAGCRRARAIRRPRQAVKLAGSAGVGQFFVPLQLSLIHI